MIEKIVMHKIPVALVVLAGQSQVLVHIESHDILERELTRLILFHKFVVYTDGRRSGRKSQDKRPFLLMFLDLSSNIICSPFAHFIVVFLNNNSHDNLHSGALCKTGRRDLVFRQVFAALQHK